MNHGGYVRYGPHNMADARPDKNNNGHYGMMIQVRRYFHIFTLVQTVVNVAEVLKRAVVILFSSTTPG